MMLVFNCKRYEIYIRIPEIVIHYIQFVFSVAV